MSDESEAPRHRRATPVKDWALGLFVCISGATCMMAWNSADARVKALEARVDALTARAQSSEIVTARLETMFGVFSASVNEIKTAQAETAKDVSAIRQLLDRSNIKPRR